MASVNAVSAWPDRIRLPFAFDPAQLAEEAAALGADAWTAHFVPQNYEGEWSALPLRARAGATHPVMMIYSDPGATDFVDTPLLARAPRLAAAIAAFRCPVHAARLMRLAPGSTIKEHRDHDLDAALGRARIHVPIATNSDVEFLLNGTRVEMAAGEAWYLRLADPHAVFNRSESARIHLVIDVMVDDWLAGRLVEGLGA